MEKCAHCSSRIVLGVHREDGKQFCSKSCARYFKGLHDGFCETCIAETTDESPGNMRLINGFGTGWGFTAKNKCQKCGSVEQTKLTYFLLPIIPKERYRVLYTNIKMKLGGSEEQYIARKLKVQNKTSSS